MACSKEEIALYVYLQRYRNWNVRKNVLRGRPYLQVYYDVLLLYITRLNYNNTRMFYCHIDSVISNREYI